MPCKLQRFHLMLAGFLLPQRMLDSACLVGLAGCLLYIFPLRMLPENAAQASLGRPDYGCRVSCDKLFASSWTDAFYACFVWGMAASGNVGACCALTRGIIIRREEVTAVVGVCEAFLLVANITLALCIYLILDGSVLSLF